MHLKPGTKIEGNDYSYTIVKTLGQGAFGITYLVMSRIKSDPDAGARTMALKEYFIKDVNGRQNDMVTCASEGGIFERMRSRFLGEARNLEDFNSGGIVKIYEAFDANNTSYFSMEYITGGNLEAYIRERGPLTPSEVKSFARQLAMSLRTMHRKNMLHLDMKPANVMMRDDSQLVLIDFGFSKRFDDDGTPASSSTLGGGTDLYRPLEQQTYKRAYADGLPTTLDVYSLSATIYKMATGRDPLPQSTFDEQFPYELLRLTGASEQLIEMLRKGLALRPKERIHDMDEYLSLIETLPEGDDRHETVAGNPPPSDPGDTPVDADGEADAEEMPVSPREDGSKSRKGPARAITAALAIIAALALIAVGFIAYKNHSRQTAAADDSTEEPAPGNRHYAEDIEFTNTAGETFLYTGDLDSTYSTPMPHGMGAGSYSTGSYKGEYRHGMRHGDGVFDFSANGNSHHYEGLFANDLYSSGRLTLPEGTWFEGTFRDGQPYTGTWYNADNTVYCKIKNGK